MKAFTGWKSLIPALLLLVGAACSSSPASQGPSKSTTPTPGGAVTVGMKQWAITPSVTTLSAGPVTFSVTNQGTITHEFVVMRTDTLAADFKVASFEGEPNRFDEDTEGTNVGETGDMEAGKTKSLTINLTPGHYAFVCNLPSHYQSGMHTDFTVT